MKKKIFGLIMPLALLASCDSYLDVKSEFDVDSNEIFSTTDGFEMAINGIYRLMSSDQLYAKNLTWGFASALGQNYKQGTTSNKTDITYDYVNYSAVPSVIWDKAFNVIANVNQVLAQSLKKDASFYDTDLHKDVIEGEMYGLRALMHFELMRYFTPAFTKAEHKKTVLMPYVDTYPCPYPTHIETGEILEKAIRDMHIAREKLAYMDTLAYYGQNGNYTYRFKSNSGTTKPPSIFFMYRGSRMNFMATDALLARMYMWKGDYKNARFHASEVIRGYRNYVKFSLEKYSDLNAASTFRPLRPSEIIMALYKKTTYHWDAYEATVGSDYSSANLTMADDVMDALFAGDETDTRYSGKYWKNGEYYANKHYATYVRLTNSLGGYSDGNMEYYGGLFPVISLPEMYFIVAECDIRNGAIANAMDIINNLRKERGILEYALPVEGTTAEEAMNYLRREVVRDGLTLGQTFFWFKRQGKNVWNGLNEIEMTEERWTIPVPDGETI